MTNSHLLAQQNIPAKVFTPPSPGEKVTVGPRTYVIGKPLGQGAFGKVYEATDMWGNELVAKVIVPNGSSYPEVKAKWEKELLNLDLVRHPNVTSIYDAFEWRDTFYIILERCNLTLNELFQIPDFDYRFWITPFCRDVLQGIEYIHIRNMVHKDLHAGNIFLHIIKDSVLPDKKQIARFKIGDLGIANFQNMVRGQNTIMAQWMLPPEVLDSNQFGPIDRRVDIYHFGLLLLRMVYGQLPNFTHQEILDGAPRKLAERLGGQYSGAISKALRRHVSQRTQSAIEFWNDLGRNEIQPYA